MYAQCGHSAELQRSADVRTTLFWLARIISHSAALLKLGRSVHTEYGDLGPPFWFAALIRPPEVLRAKEPASCDPFGVDTDERSGMRIVEGAEDIWWTAVIVHIRQWWRRALVGILKQGYSRRSWY